MADHSGPELDWTKPYRLAAGVYAMRGSDILMLERAAGMMIGFWSIPGGGSCPRAVRGSRYYPHRALVARGGSASEGIRHGSAQPPVRLSVRCG
jgi:hypothetical protein